MARPQCEIVSATQTAISTTHKLVTRQITRFSNHKPRRACIRHRLSSQRQLENETKKTSRNNKRHIAKQSGATEKVSDGSMLLSVAMSGYRYVLRHFLLFALFAGFHSFSAILSWTVFSAIQSTHFIFISWLLVHVVCFCVSHWVLSTDGAQGNGKRAHTKHLTT